MRWSSPRRSPSASVEKGLKIEPTMSRVDPSPQLRSCTHGSTTGVCVRVRMRDACMHACVQKTPRMCVCACHAIGFPSEEICYKFLFLGLFLRQRLGCCDRPLFRTWKQGRTKSPRTRCGSFDADPASETAMQRYGADRSDIRSFG